MNQDKKTTPDEWLAKLCQEYELHPQVVVTYGWRCIADDFAMRGKLDVELVEAMREFQADTAALYKEQEGPKIVEARK